MIRMYRRFILSLLTASIALTLPAFAAELSIHHDSPAGGDLPQLGSKVSLTAVVRGTRDFSIPGRLFLVRDGRLMEIPLKGTIDARDRVIYSAEFIAPVAEMSYSFTLFPPEGQPVVTSPRYAVRRPCLPSLDLTPALDQENDEVALNPVKAAHQQAVALQDDITQFESILSTIEGLKESLNRGGSR